MILVLILLHGQILSIFDTRPEIYHNVQSIQAIHERFLTQLQATSPTSAVTVDDPGVPDVLSRGLHKRLGAIDLPGFKNRSLRTRNFKVSLKQRLKALSAEPFEALEVARDIEKLVGSRLSVNQLRMTDHEAQSTSFAAYEEFCRNYELLTQDVALLRRSIPNWAVFDQGIEALSKSATSMESRKQEENQSMSLNDLLIKV